MKKPAAERFWEKVGIRGPDDCWMWIAGRDRGGYGKFLMGGRTCGAHRVAYALANRVLEQSLDHVRHSCDRRACCNPAHLANGTLTENVRDMVAKGRRKPTRGEDNPRSRLTEDDVVVIRSSDKSCNALAVEYGVRHSTIAYARNGTTWSHVARTHA
jgi:hypothetical protein